MVGQVLRQLPNLNAHLVMLKHLVLGLLALVLELACQRCILDHRQLGSAHQLVLVHVEHLDLNCAYLQEHLLAQVVNLNHFVLLDLLNYALVVQALLVAFPGPVLALLFVFLGLCLELLQLRDVVRQLLDFVILLSEQGFVLPDQVSFGLSCTQVT